MGWIALVLSGMLEAVWATALGKSEGFSRPLPSVIFVLGLLLSMSGLAFALRTVPVSTGYAVWVGIGAALTAAYAMLFDGEPASTVKILLLLGLIACVAGLKLTH
ncbi:DMT family transporter [Streptomyces seoulensis]|uniref:DMT family transporter n=1 Tax=Streptomyces seoulensis TaxID=73044 RepID=UPI001FCD3A5A|nr:multidrug efflux SMR transporter [Streptomyces seoulensis]BDH08620.1 QacE family quaternary ammonium compound efflux SMR transporter [Streptomyces seoulensis]